MPEPLASLESIVARAERRGVAALSREELEGLPLYYRYASSELARCEAAGGDARTLHRLGRLIARAHGILYRDQAPRTGSALGRTVAFLLEECPRALRAEWRTLVASLCVFYGLSLLAFVAVSSDLDLAFSLLDPEAVAAEIEQLRKTEAGEPFRGNFTFDVGGSPIASGKIMANNIMVTVLLFGAALIPPLYAFLLAKNALMLGTYLGVAAHWDQALAIGSILACHGTLELQMIILAGAAGLVLVRGVVAPGPWSRRRALELGARRAWCLMAPVSPLLVISGLIEGYVSPHAGLLVRLATAGATGALLVLWALFGGARRGAPAAA
jgi:uncharacterized membrane protein SpoIIM required for sporulation